MPQKGSDGESSINCASPSSSSRLPTSELTRARAPAPAQPWSCWFWPLSHEDHPERRRSGQHAAGCSSNNLHFGGLSQTTVCDLTATKTDYIGDALAAFQFVFPIERIQGLRSAQGNSDRSFTNTQPRRPITLSSPTSCLRPTL